MRQPQTRRRSTTMQELQRRPQCQTSQVYYGNTDEGVSFHYSTNDCQIKDDKGYQKRLTEYVNVDIDDNTVDSSECNINYVFPDYDDNACRHYSLSTKTTKTQRRQLPLKQRRVHQTKEKKRKEEEAIIALCHERRLAHRQVKQKKNHWDGAD